MQEHLTSISSILHSLYVQVFQQDTGTTKIHMKAKIDLVKWMLDNFAPLGEVLC